VRGIGFARVKERVAGAALVFHGAVHLEAGASGCFDPLVVIRDPEVWPSYKTTIGKGITRFAAGLLSLLPLPGSITITRPMNPPHVAPARASCTQQSIQA
jgi:hypothetical protein